VRGRGQVEDLECDLAVARAAARHAAAKHLRARPQLLVKPSSLMQVAELERDLAVARAAARHAAAKDLRVPVPSAKRLRSCAHDQSRMQSSA
jgi:hypothetical protein